MVIYNLDGLKALTDQQDDGTIRKYLEMNDLQSIMEELPTDPDLTEEERKQQLGYAIDILNYIENETDISTPVMDETYDILVEKFKDLGGTRVIGTSQTVEVEKEDHVGYHKYPELRGTLDKIHFLYRKDIPEKDSRKSLEDYINRCVKDCPELATDDVYLMLDLKFDGTSHIFECTDDYIDRVLTRYKVELNLGKDITHIYGNRPKVSKIFLGNAKLPANIQDKIHHYGIKCETYMRSEDFDKYKEDYHTKKCNRRSAVTSICNKSDDMVDENLRKYLTVQPLQIASEEYLELEDNHEDNMWNYVGIIDGRHQYIRNSSLIYEKCKLNEIYDIVARNIPAIQRIADACCTPIDGVVITIMNKDAIKTMGRKDDVNKFQIAYKFPAGIEKTILKDVRFDIGPVAGTITPVAEVEPIWINGNRIDSPSLSNFDKMDRLDLNIGDEVLIKYDIIPQLMKDSTCKKGTGRHIVRLTHCPVCNTKLENFRCPNDDCPSKLVGKLYNYASKLHLPDLGIETLTDLVDSKLVNTIGDLYRLNQHRKEIIDMPGYKDTSADRIIHSVYTKIELYPHELLGSIGIPFIGKKTMEKICRGLSILEFLDNLGQHYSDMVNIKGIGESKANKIIEGIDRYHTIIQDILRYIKIKPYEPEKKYDKIVVFSNTRDPKLEEYLDRINYKTSETFVKDTDYVVVLNENTTSTKVTKAKERGIPVIPIKEFKKMVGYMEE